MIGTWTPPPGAKFLLEIEVPGKAVQSGSKRGAAVRFKDQAGRWRVKIRRDAKGNEYAEVNVADQKAKELKAQAKRIAEIVEEALGYEPPPEPTPLLVVTTFWKCRAKSSHYGSGRNERKLKDSAPAFPTGTPDLTKLWRGFEDALKGIVWHDDAKVVTEILDKDFVDWWEEPRTAFAVYSLPTTVADLRAISGEEPTLEDSVRPEV